MNFAAAKEMSPYLEEPKAMPVGTPGKMGYLFLGFELDDDGRSIMRDLECPADRPAGTLFRRRHA